MEDSRLSDIINLIVSYIDPVKIILFGSRAKGETQPDSDYDLLVIYNGPKTKRELELGIRKRMRPRFFSIDLFFMTSDELERRKNIANTLAREVNENGVIVYG